MPLDCSTYETELVKTMDRVIDLLATPDCWCKRILHDGTRRCILGAMQETGGTDVLRAPILHAIVEITGKDYRQIERFNDARTTTHDLVLRVLLRARENIAKGIVADTTGLRRRALWHRFANVIRELASS